MHSRRLIDLVGQRFGRLVVIERRGRDANLKPLWLCRCDCGGEKLVTTLALRRGLTRSCGCLRREVSAIHPVMLRRKHGAAVHGQYAPEYSAWVAMRWRCRDPRAQAYKNYGGRGIAVCDRWNRSFEAFLADVGPRPSPLHSIDRYPNNDGNYEPGNVRWATALEQSRNRRGMSREIR